MKHETYLSHEEQMSLMYEEEKRSLEDQNLHVRFFALPEINVATNDSYNELRQMKEEVRKQFPLCSIVFLLLTESISKYVLSNLKAKVKIQLLVTAVCVHQYF